MKKTYIQPEAAIVSLNLIGTVLGGDPAVEAYSNVTDEGDAKENDDVVVDDDDDIPVHTYTWDSED